MRVPEPLDHKTIIAGVHQTTGGLYWPRRKKESGKPRNTKDVYYVDKCGKNFTSFHASRGLLSGRRKGLIEKCSD